jgi:hypothetical protein
MECLEKCKREMCAYPPTDLSVFVKNIRELYGYCPVADMYFDEERQEAYELSKIPIGKRRMGQQKQRRK